MHRMQAPQSPLRYTKWEFCLPAMPAHGTGMYREQEPPDTAGGRSGVLPPFYTLLLVRIAYSWLIRWKSTIELAMADLLKKAQLPELSYYQTSRRCAEPPPANRDRKGSAASTEGTGMTVNNERKPESVDISAGDATGTGPSAYPGPRQPLHYALDREDTGTSSMITAPMGSLYEVTQLGDIRGGSPGRSATQQGLVTDFISRGVVSSQEAEELFHYFDQVLNRYLWDGVALVHDNLTSVRNSSSMLSASILAVTALHVPHKERTYDICYAEFARLASGSMLDRNHTLDDLRALCIGAFWLADVSWKLSGYAVRIATEHNLHQCYRKALEGSPEHKEQATLWYLLYVCRRSLHSLDANCLDAGTPLFHRIRPAAYHPRGPEHHKSSYFYNVPVGVRVRPALAHPSCFVHNTHSDVPYFRSGRRPGSSGE